MKDELISELKQVFERWLDIRVKNPAFETIEKGVLEQAKIANSLALFNCLVELINTMVSNIDEEHLKSLGNKEQTRRIHLLQKYIDSQDIDHPIEQLPFIEDVSFIIKDGSFAIHLWSYVDRELHWIVLSIMSTSYISSMIQMRSLFELLIGIATKKTGNMENRIKSITFVPEKKKRGDSRNMERVV